MTRLLEPLAAELERPRELTAQVVNHIVGTYGVTRDALGIFLTDELPKLEDYEIDLILSPLFTPGLTDQAVFAELLGRDAVSPTEWPTLIHLLVGRPTLAQLVTEDGQTHRVPLRDVTVERFVHRLRLEATILESLFGLINQFVPAADRPLLKAIARRTTWEHEGRGEILLGYLTAATSRALFQPGDAVELLKLAETYQPISVAELIAHIPHWQRVLRQEINETGSPKPFFNERVQELHGGGRDQRRQDHSRLSAKENEQAFLARLQRVLAS